MLWDIVVQAWRSEIESVVVVRRGVSPFRLSTHEDRY